MNRKSTWEVCEWWNIGEIYPANGYCKIRSSGLGEKMDRMWMNDERLLKDFVMGFVLYFDGVFNGLEFCVLIFCVTFCDWVLILWVHCWWGVGFALCEWGLFGSRRNLRFCVRLCVQWNRHLTIYVQDRFVSFGKLYRNEIMIMTFDNCVLMVLCVLLVAWLHCVVEFVFRFGSSCSGFTFSNLSTCSCFRVESYPRCVQMFNWIKS